MTHTPIEMLSIDVSNYCSKQCPFCYNNSSRQGLVEWQPGELVRFASDCVRHGVKAVSLGGGEPFEYEGLFEVIEALYPLCYLSVTSNGLPLLHPEVQNRLKLTHPDKIHLTIHHPDHADEVNRCLQQTELIRSLGIKPGINLMVGADSVEAARNAYRQLTRTLDADQIILVPQRFGNTPSAKALGLVAGGRPFQSPSCLLSCHVPQDFASVTWDKKAGRCSFAQGKAPLPSLDFDGLTAALAEAESAFHSCEQAEE